MKMFEVKEGVDINELMHLTPQMLVVLGYVGQFCQQLDLPLVVTNILTKFPESVSNTHPEGRALDISVKGWRKSDVKLLGVYLRSKCGRLGAVNNQGLNRILVFHDAGLGEHIHLQVRRGRILSDMK